MVISHAFTDCRIVAYGLCTLKFPIDFDMTENTETGTTKFIQASE